MVAPSALTLGEELGRALALLEELDRLEHLGVAQTARRALAAALLDEEVEEVLGHVEDVAAGADDHHRAAGGDVLEGQGAGEVPGGDADAAGAADLDGLGAARRRPLRAGRRR